MFLKVIACEVAFREICYVAARSKNVLSLEFLTQGYHDNPERGLQELQSRVDKASSCEAVLLGYALCNNMLVGLTAREVPVVIPRAHDCITFFLGSKERYQEVFNACPGTYYYTSGWLEYRDRGGERIERPQSSSLGQGVSGLSTYEDWVARYGEENARYLMEVLGQWTRHYSRGLLIDFDFTPPELNLRERVQEICRGHGWSYDETTGDIGLLQRWVDGEWNEEEFLVLQPGQAVRATYDERVIDRAEA